jgi:hypothetical protein
MSSFAYTVYYKQLLCHKGYRIQSEVYETMAEAFNVVSGSVSVSHGNTFMLHKLAYKEFQET